ncbi:MAG TPA: ABC transporter ATP-binding protein [Longimicrobiales bacterium]|nr:ABC transporter ATP-binding protein [Longimicrobiales bacterium]
MTGPAADLAVEMAAIEKSFGAVRANRGADLSVRAGEIHALVGENGAGKSTLMRILAGLYRPDAGVVRVNGREVTGWTTAQAIAAGVAMVHQHFMLVPTLTVAENVVLGREFTKGPVLDLGRARRAVAELVAETGLEVPPDARVGDLTVGEAQRCEILKTLFRGARILILDEPTAVLSPPEVQDLWRVLRRLRDGGGTVILITHKLDEVVEISDTVTVMRHGATVARFATAATTPAELARAMVGRDVALAAGAAAPPPSGRGAVLEVKDLVVRGGRGGNAVDGVSFAITAGEILGIAGVEGNGQTELVEAIAGLRPAASGSIRLAGQELSARSPRERTGSGLSHIPEDRHSRGLILDYSVGDNLILGLQDRYARRGVLDRERIERNAEEKIRGFDIRPPDASLAARALSGGNQQKIVIAREMGRDFSALLAAQPTRGVDVGAIEFIHAELRRARDAGKAVLLVSADLDEVFALADRIAVLYRGRIAAVLPRQEADKEIVGEHMCGAGRGAA